MDASNVINIASAPSLDGICRDKSCTETHCGHCDRRHVDVPSLCARCTRLLREGVEDLLDLEPRLREAQMNGRAAGGALPGGDATVMLAPATWDADVEMLSAVGETEANAGVLHPAAVLGSWTQAISDWLGDDAAAMSLDEIVDWVATRPRLAVPMLTDILAARTAAWRVIGGGYLGDVIPIGINAEQRERTDTWCPECEAARMVRIGGPLGVLECPRPTCGEAVDAQDELGWKRLQAASRDDIWGRTADGWEDHSIRAISEPAWVPVDEAARAIGRHTERVRRWHADGEIRGQILAEDVTTIAGNLTTREVLHVCWQDVLAEDTTRPRRQRRHLVAVPADPAAEFEQETEERVAVGRRSDVRLRLVSSTEAGSLESEFKHLSIDHTDRLCDSCFLALPASGECGTCVA